jgi:leucyl aminopeptidase
MHTPLNCSFFFADQPFPENPSAFLFPFSKKDWKKWEARIRTGNGTAETAPAIGLFEAEAKEVFVLRRPDGCVLYLLGLGDAPGFSQSLGAFRSFFCKQKRKLPAQMAVELGHLDPEALPQTVEALANGAQLALYDFGPYKTDEKKAIAFDNDRAQLWLHTAEKADPELVAASERGAQVGLVQCAVFDLVNAPSNKKTPKTLEEWAVLSGQRHGFRTVCMGRKELEELGMHALLAVNRGSSDDPAFLVMEYRPEASEGTILPKIGLLGKGVTFDTGGISIKDSNNLHLMKSDMAGAAAVLGAMEAAARLSLPVHLVAVVPATPNDIGPNAVRPGDVIGSYAGKTIEVIDTDAEGRLILADGLAYLNRNHRPDIIIDLATLTGSCIATFGYVCAGLFTQNDRLAATLASVGDACGEKVWRLPLWDAWAPEIKSDIADLKNYHGKPMAGAIVAAKFLEAFAENHPAWAHLDIAGVAFSDTEFAPSRSATAWGVRFLVDFFRKYKSTAN